jgi:NADPH:quinone reductase-like Zn-dependent oxidoreductase
MKAIAYTRYGSPNVLELQDIDKPVVTGDDVLVRVYAASINPLDWHFMWGTPYIIRIMLGLLKPKVGRLGVDVAGVVEAVGGNVTELRAGDEVFGVCKGAFAEFVCTAEGALVLKPSNVPFEHAAAAPIAAFTALQGLRDKGRIQPGHKVLINGAAGGVGTFAVQIAKLLGAEVTGVCSTRNVNMVQSIGANHVIDYTQEDFTLRGQRYDVIFDCVGNHSLTSTTRALQPHGTLVMVGGIPRGKLINWIEPLWSFLKTLIKSFFVTQTLTAFMAARSKGDLIVIKEFLESGKVTPVIDRTYPLSNVSEAIEYLEEGHARGKVIVTVEQSDGT